jgi:hypothetical protein
MRELLMEKRKRADLVAARHDVVFSEVLSLVR